LGQVYSIIEQSLRQKEEFEQRIQVANSQVQDLNEEIQKKQELSFEKKANVQEKLQEIAELEKRKLKFQQEAHSQRDQLIKYENEHNWLTLSIKDFEREIEHLENQNKRNNDQLSKQRENKEKLEERLPYLNTRQDILIAAINQQKSELDKTDAKIDETNSYILKKEFQIQEFEKTLEINKFDLESNNNGLLKKEFQIKELEKNFHSTLLKKDETLVRLEQKTRQLKEAQIKEEELSDQITRQGMLLNEIEARSNDIEANLAKSNEEIQFILNKLGITKEEVSQKLDQVRHSTEELKRASVLIEDHKKHITQQMHELNTLEKKQQQLHIEREKTLNEISELEETVKYHQSNITKKQRVISEQKSNLKSEAEFLNELRTKVQHFQDEMAASNRISNDLEGKITELNAECINFKKLYEDSLQESLTKKDNIYNLENDINRLTMLAENKKQELRDITRTLQDVCNLIEIKEKEHCRLAEDTDIQITLVEQKKSEANNLKRDLEQTDKELSTLTIRNHAMKKDLEDINAKTLEYKRSIDIKNLDLAQGLEELKRQNLSISDKQYQLDKMQDELRGLEAESHTLKNDIKSNAVAITILENDLSKLKNHINESQVVIEKLNHTFVSDQGHLKNITEQTNDLKFELQSKENETKLISSQLREISSQTLEWERTRKSSQEKIETINKDIDKITSKIFVEENNALKIRNIHNKGQESLVSLELEYSNKEKTLQDLIDEQKRTNSDLNIFGVRKNKLECEIRDFDNEKSKTEETIKQNHQNLEQILKKCIELEAAKLDKESSVILLQEEMNRTEELINNASNGLAISQNHFNIVAAELKEISLKRKIREDEHQQILGQISIVERKIKTTDIEIVECHEAIKNFENEHEIFQQELFNKNIAQEH
jgi:chromosome segregation ATPase